MSQEASKKLVRLSPKENDQNNKRKVYIALFSHDNLSFVYN